MYAIRSIVTTKMALLRQMVGAIWGVQYVSCQKAERVRFASTVIGGIYFAVLAVRCTTLEWI